jgi:hypothetical protein
MAIKGLSDIRRLPRAGKFHLGEKRISQKSGAPYPAAVDYLIYPEEYAEVLTELFGEKAREIPIMFPVDDKDLVAPQWYKRYGSGSGLVCRGDGETALCRTESGELEEIECPGQDCEWYQKKHCRHVMNLLFIIPQLASEGVFQLDTSSFHSIVNFNSAWDYVRALTGGRIAMVPLVLRIIPKEVSPEGKKKVVHVLDIKLAQRVGLDELRQMATRTAPVVALPEPDCSTEPEYFYPPEVRDQEPEASPDLSGDLEGPEQEEVDELDTQIADLQAMLGYTQAQMAIRWRKAGGEKEAMVALLTEEYEGKPRKQPAPRKAPAPQAPSVPGKEEQAGNQGKAAPASPPEQVGWLI